MRGKAWDGAVQLTEAASDLQESHKLEGPALRPPPAAIRYRTPVPGEELLQFGPVGHVGDGGTSWAGRVQQRHEHVGSVCAEVVYLLAGLLGQAAHDPLAAANQEPRVSTAPPQGHPRSTAAGQQRPCSLPTWWVPATAL